MTKYIKWFLIILTIAIFSVCAGNKNLKRGEQLRLQQDQEAFDQTAVSHFIRGSVHELHQDHKSALLEYSEALLYDSSSATIYNKIAEQYILLKKVSSAKKILLKAVNRFPESKKTHELLAKIYFSEKKLDKAEQEFIELIELDSTDVDARYSLITVYLSKGEDLKIAQQYEKIVDLGYGTPEMIIKIGDIYLKNDLYDKAEQVFKQFLEENPDDERSYLAMAKLALAKTDTVTAIDWYQKGIKKDLNFDTCLEELRDIYIIQKKWDEAIVLLKEIIAKDISNVKNYLRLGQLYYQKGDTTTALKEFKHTTERFPDDFRAYFSLGTIYYRQGDYDEAENFFKKTIELNDQFQRGWLLLGYIYVRDNRLAEAETHFRKSVEIFPDDATFYYFLGSVLHQQKKSDKAIPFLEKALELEPENIDAMSALAMIYDEKGLFKKSDTLYEKALKLRPEDPLLMNNYSYSLTERGISLERAKAMSQKAVEADSLNGAYLDTLGWIYFKIGEYKKALKYISRAAEVRDNSAEVMEHLGDVYEKLGDMEKAHYYWKKSLELEADNPELLDKIGEK